ncbi:MAG: hypothetical protein RIR53_2000 [Bacteroidota bacterium]|jgi:hypothetical protein
MTVARFSLAKRVPPQVSRGEAASLAKRVPPQVSLRRRPSAGVPPQVSRGEAASLAKRVPPQASLRMRPSRFRDVAFCSQHVDVLAEFC